MTVFRWRWRTAGSASRPSRRRDGAAPAVESAVRVFPVRRAFGLDISDTSLEGVELSRDRRRRVFVTAYNRVLLPAGVVSNGDIARPDALQSALRELLAGARPAPFSARAIVGLPESRAYLHTFEYPASLRERQIRESIQFEAQGVLPVTLSEMSTDVVFHRSRDGKKLHALFSAVPRELVGQYFTTLAAVGIEPVAIEPETAALARALVGVRPEPVLVVDVGALRTTLAVVERGTVHGAVNIVGGGEKFTDAIMGATQSSLSAARGLKMTVGMTADAPPAVQAVLRQELQPVVREITQVLRAHETKTTRAVRTIILAGGSALLPGLDRFLSDATGQTVTIGDPLGPGSVQLPRDLRTADSDWLRTGRIFFATSTGLALRGGQLDSPRRGLNLLPRELRRRYVLWRENLALSALAAAAIGVFMALLFLLGLATLDTAFTARRLHAETEPLRGLLAGERFAAAVAEAKGVNTDLETLAAFAALTGDPRPLLERLRAAVPASVRLTGVQLTFPPGAPTSVTISLRGIANTREHFLTLERNVRKLPGVRSVDSPLTNLDRPAAVPFVLGLSVALPAPAGAPAEGPPP